MILIIVRVTYLLFYLFIFICYDLLLELKEAKSINII